MERDAPRRGADLTATSFDLQVFTGTRGRAPTRVEWHRLLAQTRLVPSDLMRPASLGKLGRARVG